MTEEQIKHMVQRFLGWKLPENFSPDCGIQFDADSAKKMNPSNSRYEPGGTNLFDATQAEAMVRYMLEGMPEASPASIEARLQQVEEWIRNYKPVHVSPPLYGAHS
jgi:hypothetical protein